MGILKTASGDPTHAASEGDIDVYETEVDTDASGDGSTTVEYDKQFSEDPTVVSVSVTDADGDAFTSAVGQSQMTLEVTGSGDTDDTVNIAVTLIGQR